MFHLPSFSEGEKFLRQVQSGSVQCNSFVLHCSLFTYLHDELGITGKLLQQHLGPAERDAEQQLLRVLVENLRWREEKRATS